MNMLENIPLAPIDMTQFETQFAPTEAATTLLDVCGVEYDNPGSSDIPVSSGSGNTNGCDLDGE